MDAKLNCQANPTQSIRVTASIAICLALGLLCTSASAYNLRTLYSFCEQANCLDGQSPAAVLLMGNDGQLYGTATGGGDTGHGTAFGLTPILGKAKWKFQRLHSF